MRILVSFFRNSKRFSRVLLHFTVKKEYCLTIVDFLFFIFCIVYLGIKLYQKIHLFLLYLFS